MWNQQMRKYYISNTYVHLHIRRKARIINPDGVTSWTVQKKRLKFKRKSHAMTVISRSVIVESHRSSN